MLAGLLFAVEEAADSPGRLGATLPFAGATLVEFQARLLIGEGASQIVVLVSRLTPELAGAINRIARRGVSVDAVRSAREAAEKLHPLARVLVLADGLVTTRDVLAPFVCEGRDTLLVTSDAQALPGLDRVGRDAIWAGVARVSRTRIDEVAELPGDYDMQSSLLRVAAQGGALHFPLGSGRVRESHAIERSSERLVARNQAVLSALVSGVDSWADRYLTAPVVSAALPLLLRREVPARAAAAGAGVVVVAALGALGWGWAIAGLALLWAGGTAQNGAGALAWLADDVPGVRWIARARAGAAALGTVLLGFAEARATLAAAPLIAALWLVAAVLIAERVAVAARKRWWVSPAALPVVLLPFALIGQPLAGLLMAGGYAAASLLSAVEEQRRGSGAIGPV